ncbi:MAG: energy-coupling factor transporter transmembrane component T [Clostridiales bacterium]
MNDGFSQYHPVINFMYFAVIILYTMFMMHPCFLILGVVGAFCYSIYLNGKKAILFNLCGMLPLLVLSAVFNPLFNHEGATIISYFSSGNPLTLESIIYGFGASFMFVTVIMWFSCYNAVMTSDKFIYLFGRIIPSISLVFSMILRFVPKFIDQAKKISAAQKCIGRDITNGNIIKRAKNGIKIISILTTWALENGIETADSMGSRGYGLSGRTSFSIFRFTFRDKLMFIAVIFMTLSIFVAIASKTVFVVYYPEFIFNKTTAFAVVTYVFYGIFCFLPLMINVVEDLKWRVLKSKI